MIKAKFSIDESKSKVTLKVKGHAGAAEVGQDIVCASASILAYTLAQNIEFAHTYGKLKSKPTIKFNEGDCTISCRYKDESLPEVVHAFLVIQTGYALLSHNYPTFVELEMFARD